MEFKAQKPFLSVSICRKMHKIKILSWRKEDANPRQLNVYYPYNSFIFANRWYIAYNNLTSIRKCCFIKKIHLFSFNCIKLFFLTEIPPKKAQTTPVSNSQDSEFVFLFNVIFGWRKIPIHFGCLLLTVGY